MKMVARWTSRVYIPCIYLFATSSLFSLRLQESLALMDLGPGSPGVVRLKHETHGVERHANLTLFFREDEYLVKSNSKCNGLLLLVFDG